MNKRRANGTAGKRDEGIGGERNSQGDSHRGKCNSERRIADDANMSVWNFGRKTRSAMNGEDLLLAILRGSKPRDGGCARERGCRAFILSSNRRFNL